MIGWKGQGFCFVSLCTLPTLRRCFVVQCQQLVVFAPDSFEVPVPPFASPPSPVKTEENIAIQVMPGSLSPLSCTIKLFPQLIMAWQSVPLEFYKYHQPNPKPECSQQWNAGGVWQEQLIGSISSSKRRR